VRRASERTGRAQEVGAIALAIRTDDLTKYYSVGLGRTAVGLEGLTLDVQTGCIFGLVGPNGSGKTTTLKLLLGLVFPTRGTGEVLGLPLGSSEYKARVGYLPEGPYFYDHLNAPELLRMYGSLFGLGGERLEVRIRELLELVDMWTRRNYRVANYSRGMRQRVGVAQALINDPDVLFFDEPTAGLDPIGAKEIREVILKLREQGKTIFLCSHLLKEMEPICDSIAILNRGELVTQGSVEELLAGEEGRFRVEVADAGEELEQALASRAVETKRLDGSFRAVFPDQQTAFEAAGVVTDRGGRLLSVGPDRRTLEEVFIEAVGEEP
jgi:ABC-2 type transport system ATP-binding protein